MFGLPLGFLVEGAVAILLALTIGYCIVLNARLKRLHADKDVLRQMVQFMAQQLMEIDGEGAAAPATTRRVPSARTAATGTESEPGRPEPGRSTSRS